MRNCFDLNHKWFDLPIKSHNLREVAWIWRADGKLPVGLLLLLLSILLIHDDASVRCDWIFSISIDGVSQIASWGINHAESASGKRPRRNLRLSRGQILPARVGCPWARPSNVHFSDYTLGFKLFCCGLSNIQCGLAFTEAKGKWLITLTLQFIIFYVGVRGPMAGALYFISLYLLLNMLQPLHCRTRFIPTDGVVLAVLERTPIPDLANPNSPNGVLPKQRHLLGWIWFGKGYI